MNEQMIDEWKKQIAKYLYILEYNISFVLLVWVLPLKVYIMFVRNWKTCNFFLIVKFNYISSLMKASELKKIFNIHFYVLLVPCFPSPSKKSSLR